MATTTAVDGTTSNGSHARKPHPDHFLRLLRNESDAELNIYLAEHSTDHGLQLTLFHIYRSQEDLALRTKAAQIQLSTIQGVADRSQGGDEMARSELTTLQMTLNNFVHKSDKCPAELKPMLVEILAIVNGGLEGFISGKRQ